jgi:hypothetical protein
LDGLAQGPKKFLIPLLCLWIYYVQLASSQRERLKLAVFVEEAHHVLYRQEHRARESVLGMLRRPCRELGIGMVVIDQHPHLISSAALGNTFATLCLNQRDPADINRAAGFSLLDQNERKWLSMLPVGQAIVKLQDRWRKPFLIQVPLVGVRKGLVTDELLARYLVGTLTNRGLQRAVSRAHGRVSPEVQPAATLDSDSFDFLHDVMQHPDDGIRQRYARLGVSGDKGNRLKTQLVETGVLEEQELKAGRTRKLLLRITTVARERFGLRRAVGRGSLAHEYWKRAYARVLRERGYSVEVEARRQNGWVNVLARKSDQTLAVEIETGKSDVASNVQNDLLSGLTKVLVVATDESAFRRVERKLARAGLLIPARVEVVRGALHQSGGEANGEYWRV